MNKITFGLGAAAVVLIGAFLGAQLLGSPGNTGSGGPSVTPEPTATAEPTATPEPTATQEASLTEGPFLVEDEGALPDSPFITVTIPSDGWRSLPEFGGLAKGEITDGPSQAVLLLWTFPVGTAVNVYGDPCEWQSTISDSPATTVDEIAAALAAQASRDASDPVDVTVGGFEGKKITLHVPDDAVLGSCDDGTFASYGVGDDAEPWRTHQGPGQVDEVWILNVNQAIALIHVMYGPDTPAALIDEMRTIAESATFEAP
jgi:hypothetical protein